MSPTLEESSSMSQSKLVLAISFALVMIPPACFGTPQDGVKSGVKSLLTTSTQQTQKSSQTDMPSADEQARIKAEVAEIMAIREQLGGGVAETLGDLSLEMPTTSDQKPKSETQNPPHSLQKSFQEQLARQASKRPTRQDSPPVETAVDLLIAERRPMDKHAPPLHERRGIIRDAARMLEEAAALLEEAQQYDQADAIRQNASQLWRSAR
jgi:hypothetical protein